MLLKSCLVLFGKGDAEGADDFVKELNNLTTSPRESDIYEQLKLFITNLKVLLSLIVGLIRLREGH